MRKITLSLLLLSFFHMSVFSAPLKKGKFADMEGYWRGQILFEVHNQRNKNPSYHHVGWMVMSIDSTGKVTGRADNECAFEGIASPMILNAPSKLNVKMYRCPDPELNRRLSGTLNKRGEFVLSWEMSDGSYLLQSRAYGILFNE